MLRCFRWDALGVRWVSSGLCRSERLIAKVAKTLRLCMFSTSLRKLKKVFGKLRKRYACECFGDFIADESFGGFWIHLGVLRQGSLKTYHCKSRSNVTSMYACYHF